MSKPAPPPTTSPQVSTEGARERHLEALRRLDGLHRKLIDLRFSIPKIIQPLTTQYASPSELFNDFAGRAQTCSEDIVTFVTTYVNCRPIFEHANASRTKNSNVGPMNAHDMFIPGEPPEPAEPVPQKPAVQQEREDAEMKDVGQPEEGIVETDTLDSQVDEVLKNFRNDNPDLRVEEDDHGTGKRTVKVTLPAPTALFFTLEIHASSGSTAAESARRFTVISVCDAKHPEKTAHLYTSLLNGITTRPSPGNLPQLLDMLASYRSLFTTRCMKCGRLTQGPKAVLPVLRRLVKDTTTEGAQNKVWKAFHDTCV